MIPEYRSHRRYIKALCEKVKREKALSDQVFTDLSGRLTDLRKLAGGILSTIDKKQAALSSDDIQYDPILCEEFKPTRALLTELSVALTNFCRRYDEIQKRSPAAERKPLQINLLPGEEPPANIFTCQSTRADIKQLQALRSEHNGGSDTDSGQSEKTAASASEECIRIALCQLENVIKELNTELRTMVVCTGALLDNQTPAEKETSDAN